MVTCAVGKDNVAHSFMLWRGVWPGNGWRWDGRQVPSPGVLQRCKLCSAR